MDNNNSNNCNKVIKCHQHTNQSIILLCVGCSAPICMDCIVSGDHLNHKIDYFTKLNTNPILEEFKQKYYSYLIGYKKSNHIILQSSDECSLKLIEEKNKEKKKILSKFSSLHKILENIKKDIIEQCKKNSLNLRIHEIKIKINNKLKNNCFYFSIPSTDEYNGLMINKLFKHDNQLLYYSNGEIIPSEYKKVILDNNIDFEIRFVNEHVEELHINGYFMKELNQFKNLKKIIIHNYCKDYLKEKSFMINHCTEVYICYKDFNKKYYYIKQHIYDNQSIFTINNENVSLVNEDAINLENSIAIGDLGDKNYLFLFKKLKNQIIFFLNGFNFKISEILKNMYHPSIIHLYDVLKPLDIRSIPINIFSLHLHDNFNQPLFKGIVPDGIEELHLYNLGSKALQFETIPKNIKRLYLHNGFSQTLIKGMVPEGVESLYLYNIGPNVLQVGSFPKTIKLFYFEDGFNQPLIEGIIPDEVERIYFYNIGSKVLQVGSIPCLVKRLYFHDKFNQPLYKGIVPEGVESLHLYKIGGNVLLFESIPFTVKWLCLEDKFNQPLIERLIPGGVTSLVLNNIGGKVLQVGSIPNTVKWLYLHDGFNQPLSKGIVPKGVYSLHLYRIGPNVLRIGSIPNTIKMLYLEDGFNQPLVKGIIPYGIQELYLYNIGSKVLQYGSIPDKVKLYFFKTFNQRFFEGIVLESENN